MFYDQAEWNRARKQANAKPAQSYADSGWKSYGHWLGTNTTSTRTRVYQSFETARAFARNLGLSSQTDLVRLLQIWGEAIRHSAQPSRGLWWPWLGRVR